MEDAGSKKKRDGGEPLTWERQKAVNPHYICQEGKAKKAAIMNEHAMQQSCSQHGCVFPGKARSNKAR